MSYGFTSADLTALREAFVTGALEVQIGDRKIRYRSQKELLEAIDMVQAELEGVSTDIDDNPNVIRGSYSRGGS